MKKISKIVLSLFMFVSLFSRSTLEVKGEEININDGLISHYTFESVEGNVVKNEVSNDYQGVLFGNNVSIKPSLLGNSLHFSEGQDGYMNISKAINSSSNDFSISLWYKYDTSIDRSNKNTVLLQQSGAGRTLLSLKADNRYSSYINAVDTDSNGSININNWQHVTYVYSPATKTISYYINGVLDSQKDAGANNVNSLTDLIIGRHKNGGNDPLSMRGYVDEIRYYGKAINQSEAKAIYEDKAGVILFEELKVLVERGSELYNSNALDPSSPLAVQLKSNLDKSSTIKETNTLGEIQEAIDSLNVAMSNYTQGISLELTIRTNNVERVIDNSIFGINHRYAFNGYGSFDSTTMKMKDDFTQLYNESGFGSLRYPGGTISNLFQWKASIGALEDRTKQIHGFYNNANQHGIMPTFGINEVGTFASDNNSEIIYVYGFGRGSAQDASDLVEYLNAPVGLNPNGGIDWAEIRANNGHPEPFNVRYFEIGNENNQGGTDGNSSQQYWTQFVSGGAEDAYIEGGLVNVNKQFAVLKDDWNKSVSDSNGTANQKRYMRYANPNPMTGDGSILEDNFEAVIKDSVKVFVGDEEWNVVNDLSEVGSNEKVFTIDLRDGSFMFGDGINGAIPQQGKEIRVSYQVQRDGLVAISKAMKETMKKIDASKECYIYSSFETRGFITKMNDRGYNDLYDGLTIHPYSGTPQGGSKSPEVFYDSAMAKADSAGIQSVKNYVAMLPEGKVPVISEFGIFRSTDPLVRSQTHAVYIGKVLMEYVNLGSPYIQKHCLVDWYSEGADSLGPTQQAVIQAVAQEGASTLTGEGEFKFFSTPSAKIFEMFNHFFGNQIIESEFMPVGKSRSTSGAYSALASKDDEGNVYVAIVNTDRTDSKSFNLNLEGLDATNKKVEAQALAGDSFTAENTLENPNNVAIEKSEFINDKATVEVELKPHSFNIIKISAKEETVIDENRVKLEGVIKEVEALNANDYTSSTWNQLSTVLDKAGKTHDDIQATDEEVIAVTEELKNAVNDLVERATENAINELKTLIDEVKLMEQDFSEEEFASMKALIQDSGRILSKDKTDISKSEVEKAIADLLTTKKGLDVIKAELIKLIEELKTSINDANAILEGNISDYRPAQLQALRIAVENGQSVLDNNVKDKSTIVEAKDSIEEVKGQLEKIANKTELDTLISKVQSLKEVDYTKDTWAKLMAELKVAILVSSNDDATDEEVAGAYKDLNNSLLGLVTKPTLEVKGQIIIEKKDANNLNPVKGAKYAVLKANNYSLAQIETNFEWVKDSLGNIVAIKELNSISDIFEGYYTTDAKGLITVNDLELGKYFIVEVDTPYGYQLDGKVYEINLEYKDQETPIIVSNLLINEQRALGKIQVSKKDATSNELIKTIIDNTFRVEHIGPNGIRTTLVPDKVENGVATYIAELLEIYEIREINAPTGYVKSNEVKSIDTRISVEDGIYNVDFLNQKTTTLPPTGVSSYSTLGLGLILIGALVIILRNYRDNIH